MMVPVPANVDIADRVLFGLTVRQLGLLAPVAGVLWAAWYSLEVLPVPARVAVVAPVAGIAVALAVGRRDGASLDALAWAALRQPRKPLSPVGASPMSKGQLMLRWPVRNVTAEGVIDHGGGFAVVIAVGTVNFGLRSPQEQAHAVAAFSRLLQGAGRRVQLVVSTRPIDAGMRTRRLRSRARSMQSAALASAATDHATWLDTLTSDHRLRWRQVVVVVTQPTAEAVWRCADGVVGAASGMGVSAEVLTGPQVGAWLRSSIDPIGSGRPS